MSTQGEGGLGCVIQCLTVKVCRQSFLAHQDLEKSMSTTQFAERRDRLKCNVFAASVAVTALFSLVSPAQAQTQPQRPNIVVIWGDDIGFWNVGAYSRGMMGYQTPTSTASRMRAHFSPTSMPSNPAPQAAPPLSSD